MAYKTPGVYVEEVSKFPPSVAAVETAIPAFIGHTQKAEDADGNSLTDKPTRIESLLAFEEMFGGPYEPTSFNVKVDLVNNNAIDSALPDKRYYLYDSLRHFYDNGGGTCYIVSIDNYDNPILEGGFITGLEAIAKVDEVTLLLFPDAVGILSGTDPNFVAIGNIQAAALAQCEKLQDRFVIMDLMLGFNEENPNNAATDPIGQFRDRVGTNSLKYGAAYYPWVITNYTPNISFSQINLQDLSDDSVINDLVPFSNGDTVLETMVAELEAKSADVAAILSGTSKASDMGLARGKEPIEAYLKSVKLNIANSSALITNTTNYFTVLSNIVVLFQSMDGNAEAELQLEIDKIKADAEVLAAITALIAMEKNASAAAKMSVARDEASIYSVLDGTGWTSDVFADIAAEGTDWSGQSSLDLVNAMDSTATTLLKAFYNVFNAAQHNETIAQNTVFSSHPFFKGVIDNIRLNSRLLPPSGTMAGIYAATDENRGVWKAPANVSLNATIGPAVTLTNKDQDGLNVHTTGKSINAIRAFTGKGILVWGARTLAGNDNEWRYVPVRRFFNFAEESIKKATEPFVFEPNDANTWAKVRAMIGNFLTLQWRAGALAGAKPEESFYVKLGLGETMTALDILEGG